MRISSGRVMPRPPAHTPATAGPSLTQPASPAFTVSAPVAGLRSNTRIVPENQAAVYAVFPSGLTATFQAPWKFVSVVQPGRAANEAHELTTGRHCAAAGAGGGGGAGGGTGGMRRERRA